MTRNGLFIVALIALAAVLASCGGHKASGVFAVEHGMTPQQVRTVAGAPYRAGPNCWLYQASKEGTSIDGMRFCFTKGRVSLIQTALHGSSIRASNVNPGTTHADLAAVRAALANRSGILAPFRPPRLGPKNCTIARGGPGVKLLPGRCETRVLRRAGERVVIFSESWSAHDFRGSGGRFRQPGSRRRLQTSWFVTITPLGKVRHVTIRGDFPPQLVI